MAAKPMTVAGLIRHLGQYPPDMPVFVTGYETGCWELTGNFISERFITLAGEDEYRSWCNGPHQDSFIATTDDEAVVQGLYINHFPNKGDDND